MRRFFLSDMVFLLFALLQGGVWYASHNIKPDMAIVPPVSSETTVKALSLGDEQFYFRLLAMDIQNAGDMFGNVTALKDYDYDRLSRWFYLLDSLDSRSNFVPAIASYYYGQTQYKEDLRYIVDYLDAHASRHLKTKWWWMAQAVYIANHHLKDKKLALRLANKLASTPGDEVPLWARQMPAFIHAELGEKEEALLIIKQILESKKPIPKEEYNFMQYFINERLDRIIQDAKKNPDKTE